VNCDTSLCNKPTYALLYINVTLFVLTLLDISAEKGHPQGVIYYRGADKSLARPVRKQATATKL